MKTNSSSPLALLGLLSFGLLATRARGQQSNCTSDDPDYANKLSPLPGVTFYWTLGEETLTSKLEYGGGEAWVAVGLSDSEGSMVGSEVVLGLPDDGTVLKYNIEGYSAAGVVEMASSRQTLTGTSLVASGGVTTMEFEKLLVEAGEREFVPGSNTLIFAVGTSTPLAFHLRRGAVTLDLTNCESTTVGGGGSVLSEKSVVAHACFMLVAWFYLVPAGIAAAVLKRWMGPHWLAAHKILQLLGAACMLAGAVVIVLAVDGADGGPGHMSDYQTPYGVHALLGVTALCAAGCQLLTAAVRPHPTTTSATASAATSTGDAKTRQQRQPSKQLQTKTSEGQEANALHEDGGSSNTDGGGRAAAAAAAGETTTTTTKSFGRRVFEWCHKGLGHASVGLALLAALSGADQAAAFSYIDSATPFEAAALAPFLLLPFLLLAASSAPLPDKPFSSQKSGGDDDGAREHFRSGGKQEATQEATQARALLRELPALSEHSTSGAGGGGGAEGRQELAPAATDPPTEGPAQGHWVGEEESGGGSGGGGGGGGGLACELVTCDLKADQGGATCKSQEAGALGKGSSSSSSSRDNGGGSGTDEVLPPPLSTYACLYVLVGLAVVGLSGASGLLQDDDDST